MDLSGFQLVPTDLKGLNAVEMNWLSRAEKYSHFHRRLHFGMMNRRFFVTERGRFGTGGGSGHLDHFNRVVEGNEVHLVTGCRVPVLLRPVKDVLSGEEKYGNDPAAFSANLDTCVHENSVYQLVGTCYVHGIMDGEATEETGFSPKKNTSSLNA